MRPLNCLLGLGLVAAGTLPVVGQPAPQQVTSDTQEYCLHLQARVSEMMRATRPPLPQEVAYLSSEGQRMCGRGQTRGGILRLRRALMLMKPGADAPHATRADGD